MSPSVVTYVLDRLADLGIGHVFGVPGDYSFPLNDAVEVHPRLQWVPSANELNAAYAADGYARRRGAGIVCTTYGVGELSALNGVMGAMAERVPVFHLVGTPSVRIVRQGLICHHTLGDTRYDRFEAISAAAGCVSARLTPENVVVELERVIDKALEDLAPRTKLFALDDDANPDDPAAGNTTAGGSGDLIADLGGGGDLAGGANKNAKLFGDDAAKKAGDGPKKATKLTQKKVGFQAEKKQKVKVFGRGVAATGGLSPRIIKSYIRRKIGAIRACYQKGLQANPSLKGKVKVKFVIQPSGKVLGAKVVQSSLNSSQVEGCITRNIKSWKFPSSQGGEITTVTYPFVFSAR